MVQALACFLLAKSISLDLRKFFMIYIAYVADRTGLDVNHPEMINATTNICE